MPTKALSKQTGHLRWDWPLTGKLRKDVDPSLIGETNFQDLINMRYTPDCPKAIGGMTKINASALSKTTVNSGFHFVKDQPTGTQESHIFVQTTDSGGTTSDLLKSDNSALPPNQDTFTSFQTLTTTNKVNISTAPQGAVCINDGVVTNIWGGNESACSQFIVYDDTGATFTYDYTNQVQNTLTDSLNRATLTTYTDGTVKACVYVGATRPLQGVKFYVGTANTTAATATAYQYTTSWASMVTTDGTATAGKTLAKTGTISFPSTATTAKVVWFNNSFLYFYKFIFDGIDTGVTVTYCTLSAANEPLVDIWDGQLRSSIGCFAERNNILEDDLVNVSRSDYVSANALTYMQVGGNNPAGSVYFGFSEQMAGISLTFADGDHVNTYAATSTVYYSSGAGWTSVSGMNDGTAYGGSTFYKTGKVTWQPPALSSEFPISIGGAGPYYWYKFVFSVALGADVRLDCVTGIPAQKPLTPHRFSLQWQDRLWLFDEINDKRNTAICSAAGTNCVFNGNDSVTKEFGDNSKIISAQTLFSRFSSSIYEDLVIFKRNGVSLLDGTAIDNTLGGIPWTIYTVSDSIGLAAENTLCKCDTSYEVAAGITKHVLVWRSDRGIEFYDGNTLDPGLSSDIKNFFDPTHSDYIDPEVYDITKESAFFDIVFGEYHWMFTNASGKQEWVCDLVKKKWYQVSRGAKALNCGFEVRDANGYQFTYGGTSDGYLEVLEDGTDFDGVAIAYTMWTGDILPVKSAMYTTKVRNIKHVCRKKTSNTITISHYGDSNTSADRTITRAMTNTAGRLAQVKDSVNLDAVFHSFKFTGTNTGAETPAYEPLFISGLFEIAHENVL